jgi:hypothetical protein
MMQKPPTRADKGSAVCLTGKIGTNIIAVTECSQLKHATINAPAPSPKWNEADSASQKSLSTEALADSVMLLQQ